MHSYSLEGFMELIKVQFSFSKDIKIVQVELLKLIAVMQVIPTTFRLAKDIDESS
jgi:hypothetical protein